MMNAFETVQALYSRELSLKLDAFDDLKKPLIISEYNYEIPYG